MARRSKTKPARSRPPQPSTTPSPAANVWLGDLRPVSGGMLDPDGIPRRTTLCLWVHAPSGYILGTKLLTGEHLGAQALAHLAQVASTAAGQKAGFPSRVVTPSAELAQALTQGLRGQVKVEVRRSAELEEIEDALLQGMESESDEELGYLDALDGEVEPGIVGAFFQAGIVFLQAAPWRSFPSERPVRVRVPKLRLERGALVVIGQSGQSHGLLLFKDLDTWEEHLDQVNDPFQSPEPQDMVSHLSASFSTADTLSVKMVEEVQEQRWPVHGGLLPSIMAIKTGEGLLPPTCGLYPLMEALMRAVAEAARRHPRLKDAWLLGEPVTVDLTVDSAAGPLQVVLDAPYPDGAG